MCVCIYTHVSFYILNHNHNIYAYIYVNIYPRLVSIVNMHRLRIVRRTYFHVLICQNVLVYIITLSHIILLQYQLQRSKDYGSNE